MDRYTHAQSHTRVNTELTQAESHAPIVQAQSHTHLNKTLKRQRAIHMDRYTHAQAHTCVNTELTQATCINNTCTLAQSHTRWNKSLKRQRATHGQVHTWSTTHLCEYRTHTSREQHASITHQLEQNAQEAEIYTRGQVYTCIYTHAQSHTHKQRTACICNPSSISHTLENIVQEVESYTHGQVHTSSITHSHKQIAMHQ